MQRRELLAGSASLATLTLLSSAANLSLPRKAQAEIITVITAVLAVAGAVMQMRRKNRGSPEIPLLINIQESINTLHVRLDSIEQTLAVLLKEVEAIPENVRLAVSGELDVAFGSQLKGIIDTFVGEARRFEAEPSERNLEVLEDLLLKARVARNTIFTRSNLNCLHYCYAAHSELAAHKYLGHSKQQIEITVGQFERRLSEALYSEVKSEYPFIDVLALDTHALFEANCDLLGLNYGLSEQEYSLIWQCYENRLQDPDGSVWEEPLHLKDILYARYVEWEIATYDGRHYYAPTVGRLEDPHHEFWVKGQPLFRKLEVIKAVHDVFVDIDVRPKLNDGIVSYEISHEIRVEVTKNYKLEDKSLALRNAFDVVNLARPSKRYDEFVEIVSNRLKAEEGEYKYAAREFWVNIMGNGNIGLTKPGTSGTPGSGGGPGNNMQLSFMSKPENSGETAELATFKIFSSTGRNRFDSPQNGDVVREAINRDRQTIDADILRQQQLAGSTASLLAMEDSVRETRQFLQESLAGWETK